MYRQSHGKSFEELLKKELGSGFMSSRMREGNVSSLFVVWQPESFQLLSLATSFSLYLCHSWDGCCVRLCHSTAV